MGEACSTCVAAALLAAAGVGLAARWSRTWSCCGATVRGPVAVPTRARPPISILKPLCGLDDRLDAEPALRSPTLPYPELRGPAGRARRRTTPPTRWRARSRAAGRGASASSCRSGEPGLNPKVNQLITLARAARHELLVISDSNTRVPPGYLDEIAAHLADDTVGPRDPPARRRGRASSTARAWARSRQPAPHRLDHARARGGEGPLRQGLRRRQVDGHARSDVRALGGFGVVKDVLAEDFVLGRLIPETGSASASCSRARS